MVEWKAFPGHQTFPKWRKSHNRGLSIMEKSSSSLMCKYAVCHGGSRGWGNSFQILADAIASAKENNSKFVLENKTGNIVWSREDAQ